MRNVISSSFWRPILVILVGGIVVDFSLFTAWCSNSSRWYHQCQARAQVRRASAEAADKAAMELSSSFAQKVPKLPHIKKTWQKISWVDFFEVILCVFFLCSHPGKWTSSPSRKGHFIFQMSEDLHLVAVFVDWNYRSQTYAVMRLWPRQQRKRRRKSRNVGHDFKVTIFWLWNLAFDVFLSLTPKNSSWIKGKNCHEIQQVMVLIHSVDLGKFRTSEDIPFHGWYPVPMKKWNCQEFQRLNADICQGPVRSDDIFAGNLYVYL